MAYIQKQGINGPIFALIALDSHNYPVSGDVTREKLVQTILDAALENGEHRSFENVLFAVAMNFPYEGGGFCFCPEADGTDDLLDVMVVSNLAKWKVSYLLPMALFGRHTGFPEVHMERCSSLSFQTDRAEPVHLDGESGGHRTEERIGQETERLRLLGDWVKEGMER